MAENRKLLVAQRVFLGIDLQSAALVAHVDEHALAHIAVGGHPAGDSHFAAFGIIRARLGAFFRGRELILERVNTLRPQRGQFSFALLEQ